MKRRMKAAAGEKEKERTFPERLRAVAVRPPPGEEPTAGKRAVPGKKPEPAEKPEEPEKSDIESLPTTARLLALKRKRERERGEEK